MKKTVKKSNFIIVSALALFLTLSCSIDGETECIDSFDCEGNETCVNGECVENSKNNTGDSGSNQDTDTDNSGNTGSTGDTGSSGNTGDTGNTGSNNNSGSTCGNGVIDAGEKCDGGTIECVEIEMGTAGTAECKPDCSDWNTIGKCKKPLPCPSKPENSEWNTVSEIYQTWNGMNWVPEETSTNYSESPSETDCRFKCIEHHRWINSKCENTRETQCPPKPDGTVWNDGKKGEEQGTYIQNGNGTDDWNPVIEESQFSQTPGECKYKCGPGYTWENDSCRELIWSKKATGKKWDDAKKYCESLSDDGGDWRFPTISDLRALIMNCPATEIDGACKITDDCLTISCNSGCMGCSNDTSGGHSFLKDTDEMWSASEVKDGSNEAWAVKFISGELSRYKKSTSYSVRCVK
ncbi:MAG: DUF1566 domain-containing protein [bacterium]